MACQFGLNETIRLADTIAASAALLPEVHVLSTSDAALANFSFGQGYLMATPLHFAAIVSTIANNGVMITPQLVKGEIDEKMQFSAAEQGSGREVVSPATAQLLQNMMSRTVTNGTGKSASPNDCSAAGKTGTAETGQIIDGKSVTQSWFVGYFPADNPQYTICVLAENATATNTQSTVIFKEIANGIMDLSSL
jgi:penicillin-binding protein 2